MSQNHLTIQFSMKSANDPKALAEKLPPLMPQMFKALDDIGTVHYSRFTQLSDKTLLFLADFDGEFGQLMLELAKHAGFVFDTIFEHVSNPPPTPVANNGEAFAEWAGDHFLHPFFVFTAYPDVTAKEIKSLATAAGVEGITQQLPFLVILPAKSRISYVELGLALKIKHREIHQNLVDVGTPHFAQFVPIENKQVGFFTIYDGSFDKYIMDFTKCMGPTFDHLFKFLKNPPPSPCSKYVQEFIDFAAASNRAPIGLYEAYHDLSVQDVHALIADRRASATSS